jgi:teichuronic acid biosynthesis glycosyltransferase TuaC
MVNVVMISNSYPNEVNRNAGIFVHEQVKALSSYGCNIKVINPIPKPFLNKYNDYVHIPHKEIYEGIEVFYPRFRFIPTKFGYALSVKLFNHSVNKKINQIIESFTPDIIHAHWATSSGYSAIRIGKKLKKPVICTLRGSDIYTYPYKGLGSMQMTIDVLKFSNGIIAVSDAIRKQVGELYKSNNSISVVYNGVDTKGFKPLRQEQIVNNVRRIKQDNDIIILFVGTIKKEKGIFELLEAFNIVSKKASNLKLLIIGDGSDRQKGEDYCATNELDTKVFFLGKKNHSELVYWYNFSDFVVLPSYSEGLPNVLVEAVSCGKPVIASNVGGIPEIVMNETGLLVEARKVGSLVSAIDKMIENEGYKKKFSQHFCRNIIEMNFDREKNIKKIYDLYKKVINEFSEL